MSEEEAANIRAAAEEAQMELARLDAGVDEDLGPALTGGSCATGAAQSSTPYALLLLVALALTRRRGHYPKRSS